MTGALRSDALTLAGRGTGDLMLVYLSCHGLLDVRRRLYFAATCTRKDRLGATGVEAAWVLDQLEHCRGPPPDPHPGSGVRRARPAGCSRRPAASVMGLGVLSLGGSLPFTIARADGATAQR